MCSMEIAWRIFIEDVYHYRPLSKSNRLTTQQIYLILRRYVTLTVYHLSDMAGCIFVQLSLLYVRDELYNVSKNHVIPMSRLFHVKHTSLMYGNRIKKRISLWSLEIIEAGYTFSFISYVQLLYKRNKFVLCSNWKRLTEYIWKCH